MSDPTSILVVSLGMSPPVVTETLWSLFRRDPPVVPGEIHLLTTRLGERSVRRGNNGAFLCDPDDAGGIDGERGGRLGELYDAFGHPRPTVHIHVPEPEPDDLRDEGSTLDYANLCVRVLARLRQTRPDARLHVSLAGGRKTMGFFLGYALSLLGGPRDELSHVLVRPADFEGADFWWPGGPPGVLQRGGHRLSTADARVDLVIVPFVTLSAWIDPSLLTRLVLRELNYADLIDIVRPKLDPVLHLRRADRSAGFGGRTVRLKPSEYALLEVIAHAFGSDWSGYGPEGPGGRAGSFGTTSGPVDGPPTGSWRSTGRCSRPRGRSGGRSPCSNSCRDRPESRPRIRRHWSSSFWSISRTRCPSCAGISAGCRPWAFTGRPSPPAG